MSDSNIALDSRVEAPAPPKKLLAGLTEDWWAVGLGLGIIILAYIFYLSGSSISWIAVAPAKWSNFSQLGGQLAAAAPRYLALLIALLVLFSIVVSFIGQKPSAFVPSFIFLFVVS